MYRGVKIGDKSVIILKAFLERGEMMFDELLATNPLFRKAVARLFHKQIYNLKRQGYLKQRSGENNKSFFNITSKGRFAIIKWIHRDKLLNTKWDGYWRVIIFDIPEKTKKYRDYLRNELRNLGFYKMQESVYITPYPVTDELNKLLEERGMRRFFRFLTVSEIDKESELKSIFGIK